MRWTRHCCRDSHDIFLISWFSFLLCDIRLGYYPSFYTSRHIFVLTFDIMMYFFDIMMYFLTLWPKFWRHDIMSILFMLWSDDVHFDVVRYIMKYFVDVAAYFPLKSWHTCTFHAFWRQDTFFNLMTYFLTLWRVLFTSRHTLNEVFCNVITYVLYVMTLWLTSWRYDILLLHHDVHFKNFLCYNKSPFLNAIAYFPYFLMAWCTFWCHGVFSIFFLHHDTLFNIKTYFHTFWLHDVLLHDVYFFTTWHMQVVKLCHIFLTLRLICNIMTYFLTPLCTFWCTFRRCDYFYLFISLCTFWRHDILFWMSWRVF